MAAGEYFPSLSVLPLVYEVLLIERYPIVQHEMSGNCMQDVICLDAIVTPNLAKLLTCNKGMTIR